MLPDGRVRYNRRGDWGEKRPILVGIDEDVPLKVLTAATGGRINPLFRVMQAGTVVIEEGDVDGFTDPESTSIKVWWYPDLESEALQALPDGAYEVIFRFEARAAGESEIRRYVRSVGVYFG